MDVTEQLMEKDEELNQYKHVVESFKQKESHFEKVLKDREHREDELLCKMSVLADHFDKEKDKSSKLMQEI